MMVCIIAFGSGTGSLVQKVCTVGEPVGGKVEVVLQKRAKSRSLKFYILSCLTGDIYSRLARFQRSENFPSGTAVLEAMIAARGTPGPNVPSPCIPCAC